jgi:hypothetical protein
MAYKFQTRVLIVLALLVAVVLASIFLTMCTAIRAKVIDHAPRRSIPARVFEQLIRD